MKHQLGAAWLVALLLGIPPTVFAQATNSSNETELIKALLSRIEQLEKRVVELEARQPETGKAPLVKPVSVDKVDTKPLPTSVKHESLQQAVAAELQPTYPSLKFLGFTDINFSATDQRGSKSGFNEGQFVLHLTSALAPKVSYFGELSLTARTDAGRAGAAGFNAEVERTIIRFDQSDYLKVSLGRYHTPVNWWNTAFHHGQWLQTTISRPEMTQFGGRFIPVHFVGGLVEGALPTGGLNLNYNIGLGNGRSFPISRGGDFGDINNNKALLVNLFSRPDPLFGLQVGASAYHDKITLARGNEFREWITAAHIVWEKENPEVIAEFANVNHEPLRGGGSFNSQAFYIQAGYRLPWFHELWKPYYRFEYITTPRAEPVWGAPTLDLRSHIFGLRYDISDFAALKAEYRNQERPRQVDTRVDGVFLQASFGF